MEIGPAWFLMWPALLILAAGAVLVRLTVASLGLVVLSELIGKRPVRLVTALVIALFNIGAALLSHSYGVGFYTRVIHEPGESLIHSLNLAQLALGAVVAAWTLAREDVSETRPA